MNRGRDLARGIRGKYAEAYRRHGNVVTLDIEPGLDVTLWAPLVDFSWDGTDYDIARDMRVVSVVEYSGFETFARVLSEEERQRCREIGHWLRISHRKSDDLSTGDKINAFLLALWIVRPTMTQIPFYFGETDAGTRSFHRVLDRFQWVKGQVALELSTLDLRKLKAAVEVLAEVYVARRRLRNALVLTVRGCTSRDWQVGIVCFTSAIEAMLTYSTDRGVTDRLARAYARLVSRSESRRKSAEERFRRLYRVRSDIVHGRVHDRSPGKQNLRDLKQLSNLLRRLWQIVIARQALRQRLEEDNRVREAVLAPR